MNSFTKFLTIALFFNVTQQTASEKTERPLQKNETIRQRILTIDKFTKSLTSPLGAISAWNTGKFGSITLHPAQRELAKQAALEQYPYNQFTPQQYEEWVKITNHYDSIYAPTLTRNENGTLAKVQYPNDSSSSLKRLPDHSSITKGIALVPPDCIVPDLEQNYAVAVKFWQHVARGTTKNLRFSYDHDLGFYDGRSLNSEQRLQEILISLMSQNKEFWMHPLPQTEIEIENAKHAQQDAIKKQQSERMQAHLQALDEHYRTLHPRLTPEEIARRQSILNQEAQEKLAHENKTKAATKRVDKALECYRKTGDSSALFR